MLYVQGFDRIHVISFLTLLVCLRVVGYGHGFAWLSLSNTFVSRCIVRLLDRGSGAAFGGLSLVALFEVFDKSGMQEYLIIGNNLSSSLFFFDI